jgi:hypothetical protein
MPIEFPCPQCNQLLRTPDGTGGRKAKCPQCASLVDIPNAQPERAASPNGPGVSTARPGSVVARDTADTADTNPYTAPREVASPPDFGVGAPGEMELTATRVTMVEILSRTWQRFTENLVPCILFGLIAIGVQMLAQVVNIPLQVLQAAFGEEPAVVIGSVVAQQVWGIVVQAIAMCIAILFTMKFLRRHPEPLKGIFNVGPFFARLFLTQIIIMLMVLGVAAVCALPFGIASLAKQDVPVLVATGVIGVVTAIPFVLYLYMRLSLAQFLIVDRRQGIMEALTNSGIFMKGNVLTLLTTTIVVGILQFVFIIATCCIGSIFAIPFFMLTAAVIYASVTGQWPQTNTPAVA